MDTHKQGSPQTNSQAVERSMPACLENFKRKLESQFCNFKMMIYELILNGNSTYTLPITITFICPMESVMGPEKTRKGSEVTIPTATVHPIMNRDDSTSMFAYKSSKYLS